MSFPQPLLSPVGAVDLSNEFGTCTYQILVDSSMCTLGNILMFEYKYTNANETAVTPETTTLGYVNLDASFQCGIQNQWNLAIPSEDNDYDPGF